jgi:hypothetical protein
MTLTGGNLGQGFNGTVVPVIALSVGTAGPNTVQNATFTDWTANPNAALVSSGFYNSGVTFAGSTPNDMALQTVVGGGLYGAPSLTLTLTDSNPSDPHLTAGTTYLVQVLSADNSDPATRGETLSLNGVLEGQIQPEAQNTAYDIYATFVATGNDTVTLTATAGSTDAAGLLSGVTFTAVVPEPASAGLMLLGLGMWSCRRRKENLI